MQKEEVKIIINTLDKMFPNAGCELDYDDIYTLAIAVILSAQTTDKKVNIVTKKLFKKYPTVNDLSTADYDEVKKYITPLGLSTTKAKNIIQFSKKVVNDYNEIIPSSLEELITLPGVGRKTANVILSEGYKINRIAVDTHVERTSKRLGLAKTNDSVLQVENKLMEQIEENNWHHTHHLLIHFGRYFCKSQNPKCIDCPFKNICTGYKIKNSN